jgi:hypothetical protein
MAETTKPLAYLLADDLMWISRVTGTAHDLDLSVVPVRTVEKLAEVVATNRPRCVIVDLGTAAPAAVAAALDATGTARPRLVGFGSHVDVATLAAARQHGFDPVLPRSKMAEGLSTWLPQWLGESA